MDVLLDLGVAHQVEVLVDSTGAVDVRMRTVRTSASVAVNPLEPLLGTMSSNQVLEIIGDWNALALYSAQEVLHDRVF